MNPIATTIVKELLDVTGVPYTSITESELAGQHVVTIHTDDARSLIGTRGDTVHALDFLAKKIAEKRASEENNENTPLFLVDVNDYRAKQIKDLQTRALMMAERARSFQYDVELSPMSSYERLIVHATLADTPHIKTESQGEGRDRRVVIKYSA